VNNYESHSNSVSSPPETYIFSDETVWANKVQNIYLKHSFTSDNQKFGLNSILSAQELVVLPKTLYINEYSGFEKAYKYARDRAIKLEEQINYNFNENVILVGGVSYELIKSIPKTSDLPYEYDTKKTPDEQTHYYPGTQFTDLNGNDLTIAQDFYHIDYNNVGTYLQLQAKFSEKVSLTAGSRFDYNSVYGSTFNPRAGLVIKPSSKFTVKLLYGQAYLAPSPIKSYQHYGSFYPTTNSSGQITGLASGFWFLPNPDLEPEKRKSFDANFIYQLNSNLAISLIGYYGVINNLVTTQGFFGETFHGVSVGYVSRSVNAGDATTYGGSFRIDYKGDITSKLKLNLFAVFSYSDGDIDGNPLINTAKNTIKAGFDFNYKQKANVYATVQYRSGSHSYFTSTEVPLISDPYTLINLTANYKIIQKEKLNLSFFANVVNLLNIKYYNSGNNDFVFASQDPIRVDFGLKVDF